MLKNYRLKEMKKPKLRKIFRLYANIIPAQETKILILVTGCTRVLLSLNIIIKIK